MSKMNPEFTSEQKAFSCINCPDEINVNATPRSDFHIAQLNARIAQLEAQNARLEAHISWLDYCAKGEQAMNLSARYELAKERANRGMWAALGTAFGSLSILGTFVTLMALFA